ncbi:MAG: hypothetical protein AB8G11_09970 [Saprospiraceae bacterium]
MTIVKIKRRILSFMLLSKVLVILTILFHWQTGGYSTSEMLATITLIIPLFTVYITVIIKDTMENPYRNDAVETPEKKVKKSLVNLTYIIFPIYIVMILYIISLKPQPGSFTFANLQTSIAIIESGLGVYIGQIIFTLFDKDTE